MKSKKTKFSIATLFVTALACFVVAITGMLTGFGGTATTVNADITPVKYNVSYTNTNNSVGEGVVTKELPAEGATKVTFGYTVKSCENFPASLRWQAVNGTAQATVPPYAGNDDGTQWTGTYGKIDQANELVFDLTTNKIAFNTTHVTTIDNLSTYTHFGLFWMNNSGMSAEFEMYAYDDTGKDLGVIGSHGAGWVVEDTLEKPTESTYLTTFSNGDYQVVTGSTTSWSLEGYQPALAGIATETDGVLKITMPTASCSNIGIRFGRTLTAEDVAKGGDLIIRFRYESDNYFLKYQTLDGWNKKHAGKLELRGYVTGGDANSVADFVEYKISGSNLAGMLDADGELKGIQFGIPRKGTYENVYFDSVRYEVGYKVTFNTNGGSDVEAQNVMDGTTATPAATTKAGYAFAGWFVDEGLTERFDFSTAITKNITLYAKWSSIEHVKEYTVSLKGEAVEDTTKHFEASSRLSRSADATKIYIEYKLGNDDGAGHSFLFGKCAGTMVAAWRTTDLWNDKDGFAQANTHIWATNNAALYTASYKVIFDLVTNQMVWYRGNDIILEGTGTDFASAIQFGFYTGTAAGEGSMTIKIYDDLGKDLGVTSREMKDLTINFPKATFDVNYDGGEDVVIDVTNATVSAPNVERAGYKFLGWYTDAECTTELVIPAEVASDFTAYAKWELNEFTVNFNTNGGTAVDTQTVQYNGKATVPVEPTLDGYYFVGWFANEGLTVEYDFDSAVTTDITVYAKWISFDAYYAGIVSTGAPSIRINEKTTSGIRFATTVDKDLLDRLKLEGYTYTLGTLIVPFDYVGEDAPTMEWLDSQGKGYYNVVSTYDGSTDSFFGTLQSLRESNYGRKWVGLGYVAIDMDGEVKYIYSAFDKANALSIYDVAESFYNEYKDVADEVDNVEIAKHYIDSVVVLDANYAVVDKATDTEIPYEVAIVDDVVTITVKEGVDFAIKSVVINGKIAKVEIAAGYKSATYQIA